MTAGGGKTNMLIYLCSVLRQTGVSFIVLVYNVAAKHELLSRGLQPHEVNNFHSFAYRALTSVLSATLTEDRVMSMESSSSLTLIKPTVCEIKIRLVTARPCTSPQSSHQAWVRCSPSSSKSSSRHDPMPSIYHLMTRCIPPHAMLSTTPCHVVYHPCPAVYHPMTRCLPPHDPLSTTS